MAPACWQPALFEWHLTLESNIDYQEIGFPRQAEAGMPVKEMMLIGVAMIIGIPLVFLMMMFMALYFLMCSIALKLLEKKCHDIWDSWGSPGLFVDSTISQSFSVFMRIIFLKFSEIYSPSTKALFYVLAVMNYIWILLFLLILVFSLVLGNDIEDVIFYKV